MYSPQRKSAYATDSPPASPSLHSDHSSDDSDVPYVNGEKVPEYFKINQINEKLFSLCQTIKDKLPEVVPDTVYEITQWINFPVQVVFSGIHNGGNDYGEYYMSTRSIGEFVLYLLNANMSVKTNITTTIVRKFKALNPETYHYGLLVKTIGQKPEKTYTVQSIPVQSEQVSAAGRGRGSHQNSRGTSYYWPFAYIPKIINPLLYTISKSKAFKDIQYYGPPVLPLNHPLTSDDYNGDPLVPATSGKETSPIANISTPGSEWGSLTPSSSHFRNGAASSVGAGKQSTPNREEKASRVKSEFYSGSSSQPSSTYYHDSANQLSTQHPYSFSSTSQASSTSNLTQQSLSSSQQQSQQQQQNHHAYPLYSQYSSSSSNSGFQGLVGYASGAAIRLRQASLSPPNSLTAGAKSLIEAASKPAVSSPNKRKERDTDSMSEREYELFMSIEAKKKKIEKYNNDLVSLVFEVAEEEQELRKLRQ